MKINRLFLVSCPIYTNELCIMAEKLFIYIKLFKEKTSDIFASFLMFYLFYSI